LRVHKSPYIIESGGVTQHMSTEPVQIEPGPEQEVVATSLEAWIDASEATEQAMAGDANLSDDEWREVQEDATHHREIAKVILTRIKGDSQ
jgi:hypothetical protein